MKNELTVDDNGEWCAAFAQDQYLVSDKVLAALNEGMKTWHIERDFVEGLDYKKSEEQCQRNDGALCFIYRAWCRDNGLPYMSADELLAEESVEKTLDQTKFIKSFITIWDYATDLEVQA